LYALAPVSPTGLTVTYFMTSSFGGATVTRTDASIDINKDVAPPGATPLDLPSGYGPSYSARWEGEIVPSFTEDHTFYVVGSGSAALTINGNPVSFLPPPPSVAPGAGCAHDACTLGAKLDASCDTCVAAICANDPFCCDGGYLSYYSFEPVWDAKCIADVAAYCPGVEVHRAAADAAGLSPGEICGGRVAGGRALPDDVRVQEPEHRQDGAPLVVEPAAGEAGDSGVRVPSAHRGRCRRRVRSQCHVFRHRSGG
jgi:hypothetical protein